MPFRFPKGIGIKVLELVYDYSKHT